MEMEKALVRMASIVLLLILSSGYGGLKLGGEAKNLFDCNRDEDCRDPCDICTPFVCVDHVCHCLCPSSSHHQHDEDLHLHHHHHHHDVRVAQPTREAPPSI